MYGNNKMGFLLSVLLLFVSVVVGCGFESQLTDAEYLARGKQHLDKRDLNASAIELKNALKVNPDNAEARWLLGTLYLEANAGADAEKELVRGLELGIPLESLMVDLGKALLLQRKYPELLERLEHLKSDDPRRQARYLALRGDAQFGQGQLETATQSFNAALRLDPFSSEAKLGMGRVALWNGHLEDSIKWYQEAIEHSPESPEAWILLGNAHIASKNYQAAKEAYDKAIEHSYFSVTAHLQRALSLIYMQEFSKAKADLNVVRRTASRYPRVYFVEGVLNYHQKEAEKALESFGEAVKLAPEHLPTRFYLGATQFSLGNYQQADRELMYVLVRNPGDLQAGILLAATKVKLGDLDTAERLLLPIMQVASSNLHVLKMLGQIYFAKGEIEKSVEYYRMAEAADGDNAGTKLGLGVALLESGDIEGGIGVLEDLAFKDKETGEIVLYLGMMRSGRYQDAVELAQKINREDLDAPLGRLLLGTALRRQGDMAGARKAFMAVLQQYPGHPGAALNLAEIEASNGGARLAEQLYYKVLEHNPGHVDATVLLAQAKTKHGDMQEAKKLLETAVKIRPESLAPRVFLANYYRNIGEISRALSLLEGGDEAWFEDPRYLLTRGETELAINQYANAENTLMKLVQVSPGLSEGHYLLGIVKLGLQKMGQARVSFESAVKTDPGHINAQIALIRMRFSSGEQEKARSMADALVNTYATHPEVLALKGWMAMRSGDPKAATQWFTIAARQAATPRLIIDLARMQWDSFQFEQAQETLNTWLERNPDDVAVRVEKASLYLLQNREDAARSEYEKVLHQVPDHVVALNNLAWLYRLENPKKALVYIEKAYALTPEDPVILDTYGMVLYESGNAPRALRMVERAFSASPKSTGISFNYAKVLAGSGETDKAEEVLTELLASGGDFVERGNANALLESIRSQNN